MLRCLLLAASLAACLPPAEKAAVPQSRPSSTPEHQKTPPEPDSLATTTCSYRKLSDGFDYTLRVTSIVDGAGDYHPYALVVDVRRKGEKALLQRLREDTVFLYSNDFDSCLFARSYVTHVNDRVMAMDFDFGNLVIADLSFDGREDIAVKIDGSSVSGGPLYGFWLQDSLGKFVRNAYLSKKMRYFPDSINVSTRTLTTFAIGGVCRVYERSYQCDPAGDWRKVKDEVYDHCNE